MSLDPLSHSFTPGFYEEANEEAESPPPLAAAEALARPQVAASTMSDRQVDELCSEGSDSVRQVAEVVKKRKKKKKKAPNLLNGAPAWLKVPTRLYNIIGAEQPLGLLTFQEFLLDLTYLTGTSLREREELDLLLVRLMPVYREMMRLSSPSITAEDIGSKWNESVQRDLELLRDQAGRIASHSSRGTQTSRKVQVGQLAGHVSEFAELLLNSPQLALYRKVHPDAARPLTNEERLEVQGRFKRFVLLVRGTCERAKQAFVPTRALTGNIGGNGVSMRLWPEGMEAIKLLDRAREEVVSSLLSLTSEMEEKVVFGWERLGDRPTIEELRELFRATIGIESRMTGTFVNISELFGCPSQLEATAGKGQWFNHYWHKGLTQVPDSELEETARAHLFFLQFALATYIRATKQALFVDALEKHEALPTLQSVRGWLDESELHIARLNGQRRRFERLKGESKDSEFDKSISSLESHLNVLKVKLSLIKNLVGSNGSGRDFAKRLFSLLNQLVITSDATERGYKNRITFPLREESESIGALLSGAAEALEGSDEETAWKRFSHSQQASLLTLFPEYGSAKELQSGIGSLRSLVTRLERLMVCRTEQVLSVCNDCEELISLPVSLEEFFFTCPSSCVREESSSGELALAGPAEREEELSPNHVSDEVRRFILSFAERQERIAEEPLTPASLREKAERVSTFGKEMSAITDEMIDATFTRGTPWRKIRALLGKMGWAEVRSSKHKVLQHAKGGTIVSPAHGLGDTISPGVLDQMRERAKAAKGKKEK